MMHLLKHHIGSFANKLFFSLSYLLNKVAGRDPVLLTGWVTASHGKISKHNLGDDLNYFLLKELTKRPLFFTEVMFPVFKHLKHYCCIGSIIENFANSHSVIWGSGAIEGGACKLPSFKVLSVRGPLTRTWLMKQGIDCPECYGDPALLLPLVYDKRVKTKYEYGFIPHFLDFNLPHLKLFLQQHPDMLVIDMQHYDDWHNMIDKIRSCRNIISSSLHGIIIADTYGIPNVWIELSENVQGHGFKFHDYFMSVNRDTREAVNCKESVNMGKVVAGLQSWEPTSFNLSAYKETMPF